MKRKKNKIDKIYIACYSGDFWQTKICVASIRKWYPKIPIFLIKDIAKDDFNTKDLETVMDVQIADFELKRYGWGVSKFEPYFINERVRCLILDSDIIFLGKVLDYLEGFSEDFVVSAEFTKDYNAEWFKKTYYDIDGIKEKINENFEYPGYIFNTGQICCNTGIFSRDEFTQFVTWDGNSMPKLNKTEVFSCADQGILNYYLPYKENKNEITIGKADYEVWGSSEELEIFELNEIISGQGYPKLIHWSGGFRDLNEMKRNDLIIYYQKLYYKFFFLGEFKRLIFNYLLKTKINLIHLNLKYSIKRRLLKLVKQ